MIFGGGVAGVGVGCVDGVGVGVVVLLFLVMLVSVVLVLLMLLLLVTLTMMPAVLVMVEVSYFSLHRLWSGRMRRYRRHQEVSGRRWLLALRYTRGGGPGKSGGGNASSVVRRQSMRPERVGSP